MRALVAISLVLAACGEDRALAPPAPPASLTQHCARPQALPERDMTQGEVEVLWGRDRTALRACGGRHAGLVDYVERF